MSYIKNPGFETGDFTGWTKVDGGVYGTWSVQSGAGAYQGTYYAYSTQGAVANGLAGTAKILNSSNTELLTMSLGSNGAYTLTTFSEASMTSYVGTWIKLQFSNFISGPNTTNTITSDVFYYTGGGVSFYYHLWTPTDDTHFSVDLASTNIQTTWEVGSGKEYSTITGALNGLYAAVGTSTFTQDYTVLVYNGTYTEAVAPNSGFVPGSTYYLYIKAAEGNSPVIDGENTRSVGITIAGGQNHYVIEGFDIYRFLTYGISLTGGLCTIRYNYIHNNGGTTAGNAGIYMTGNQSGNSFYGNSIYSNKNGVYMTGGPNANLFYNNTFDTNTDSGIYMTSGTTTGNKIYQNIFTGSSGVIITNGITGANYIYNNLFNNAPNVAFYLDLNVQNQVFYENTVYKYKYGIYYVEGGNNSNLVKNNIFWADGTDTYCYMVDNSATLAIDYNDVWTTNGANVGAVNSAWTITATYTTFAQWKAAKSTDASSINADPLFVNAGGTPATSYYLTASSPAKNVGTTLGSFYNSDYVGTARPQGSSYDMGFYEAASSGAGLYEVGSGKTYATIQAALDQLYADQGSAAFTATQTVRVYDGTYTEQATPNTALNPTSTYRLVIEAAPGNSPIIDGSVTRNYCIYINAIDYVTITGFEVKRATDDGIRISGSTYCIVEDCNANTNNDVGIQFMSSSSNGIIRNCVTSGNTVAFDGVAGIQITGNSTNCEISGTSLTNEKIYSISIGSGCTSTSIHDNTISLPSGNAINIASANTCLIYKNSITSSSTGYGIVSSGTTSGTKIYQNIIITPNRIGISGVYPNSAIYNNLIKGTGSACIDIDASANVVIYGNTLYTADAATLALRSSSTSATIKNNIAWMANALSNREAIYITADSQAGLVCDYNDLYATGGASVGLWGATKCVTLADWRTTSSQDAHSISSDPSFINLSGTTANDFKISSASPCRDTGATLSTPYNVDYFDKSRPQGVAFDIGFYEFFFPTNMSKVSGIAYVSIKNLNSIPMAGVGKLNGIV